MTRGYSTDLAAVHEAGFGRLSAAAAPVLARLLRRRGSPSGTIVELGCGPGLLARDLTTRGFEVLGVDVSPAMIRRARRNAPAARFRTGSAFSMRFPSCAAVVAVGECLNYAFDRTAGPRAFAALVQRVHASLQPGGLFAFDVRLAGSNQQRTVRRLFHDEKNWAVLVEIEADGRRHLLRRRITTFRRHGHGFRRTREDHVLRLYRLAQVVEPLRTAGFSIRMQGAWGNQQLEAGHVVVLARRR